MGQHRSNAKCVRCGTMFDVRPSSAASETIDDEPLGRPPLSKEAKRALGIGFALALVIWLIPFFKILFHPLSTIIHELGHTMAAWVFGYQAIPAFDFSEGGGLTITPEDQSRTILAGVYLVFAYLLYVARVHLPTLVALLVLIPLHAWLTFGQWHQAVILGMGHGLELVFAAVFLYRAMTGTTLLQADERPAYAMVGFLILLDRVSFFYKLATDHELQAWYLAGKDSADNDLVRIGDTFWNASVQQMSRVFIVLWLLMPLVARLFYRYEGPMWLWASRFIKPRGNDTARKDLVP